MPWAGLSRVDGTWNRASALCYMWVETQITWLEGLCVYFIIWQLLNEKTTLRANSMPIPASTQKMKENKKDKLAWWKSVNHSCLIEIMVRVWSLDRVEDLSLWRLHVLLMFVSQTTKSIFQDKPMSPKWGLDFNGS